MVGLLAGVIFLIFGCKDKIEPGHTAKGANKTIKAPVAVAEMGSKPFLYEAVGTVHARTSSTISSKLMGTVKAVYVREGDTVKKDDLLVEIDERQVAAQLRKAEAGMSEARRALASAGSSRDAARASAKLAKITHERYQKLLAEESVSRQEFDEIEARHRQAQA
ncbi:MAG: biotin/lipoyl-binding protein, partial [Deltaproteobacteria bacterium]|nr:biotin/lipoyl-binding protein [Deltaproteobacteria bacterium]